MNTVSLFVLFSPSLQFYFYSTLSFSPPPPPPNITDVCSFLSKLFFYPLFQYKTFSSKEQNRPFYLAVFSFALLVSIQFKPHFSWFLLTYITNRTVFLDVTPCSPLLVHQRFGGTKYFHLQRRKVSSVCCLYLTRYLLSISSILEMEAIRSSETSMNFYRTTRRYILWKITLPSHRCEDLKSLRPLITSNSCILYRITI
jgi:hypothetical protein